MKRTSLTLLLLFASVIAFAQFTITGEVIDAEDNTPVESATVFINNTLHAGKTNKKGEFTVRNLQGGQYELIVSMVGFKAVKTPITLHADLKLSTIYIKPRVQNLKEVVVSRPKKLPNKYLEIFNREILGTSKFAKDCHIDNPKVIQLDFDSKEKRLSAYTSDFMVVQNNALGYRLKYLVEDFERNEHTELLSYIGYVLFEEMDGSEKQKAEWYANRIEAYTGSIQHFFRSVAGNNINLLREPGFLVRTLTRTVNPYHLPDSVVNAHVRYYANKSGISNRDSLYYWQNQAKIPRFVEVIDTARLQAEQVLRFTDQPGVYALRISDTNYLKKWEHINVPGVKVTQRFNFDTCKYQNMLYVTYIKTPFVSPPRPRGSTGRSFIIKPEMEEKASLIVPVDGNVLFNSNGVLLDPMNLKMEKYWARLRLGDLLPIDYLPNTGNGGIHTVASTN